VKNRFSVAVAITLVALIAVAGWQFYSLVWGEVLRGRYTVGVPDAGSQGGMNQRPTPATRR
jgi:hypothetical protein